MKSHHLSLLILSLFMMGIASSTYISIIPHTHVLAAPLSLGDPWSTIWMQSTAVSFNAIAATADAVFVAGTTFDINDIVQSHVLLIKYSLEGEHLWNQTWDYSYNQAANALSATTDALYLAGVTTTGLYGDNGLLVKMDYNGNQIWNVSYGTFPAEYFTSVAIGVDGVYVGGFVKYAGNYDVAALLVKFDFDGNELWTEKWDRANVSVGLDVAVGSNGIYLVGEYGAQWNGASNNAFLAKYSLTGVQVWNTTYGGSGRDVSNAVSVFNDTIYVTGSTISFSNTESAELFLSQYNSTGNLNWSRQNATGFNHQGICVQATENTIFVGGQFNSSSSGFRLSFLSFNDSGAQNFIRIWGGAGPCQPTNLASASDSIYFSGTINNWLSSHDSGFLVKFGLDGESAPGPVAIHDVSLLSPYGSFVLEWTSALDPDGFIEDYELQMDTSPNFYRPDITWMVNTTYQFITNLPYGTYYFRVRACDNSNLYGPWSNIMVVIAALIPPTLFNPWLAPAILLLGTLVIVAIILFMVIRRRHFQ